jgi:hypothetical protein
MQRPTLATAAVLGLLGFLAPAGAQAQPYIGPVGPPVNPYVRPPLSPYLNLLGGGNPAINYFGIVRPQQQFGLALGQLQQQVLMNQTALASDAALAIPTTGHPTRFMNYSHYFFNQGGLTVGGTAPVGFTATVGPNPVARSALGTVPQRQGAR